jgi:hypothetical protein
MITTISIPQLISPVYNPFYFVVDSDNNTEDNFNYIFDLYDTLTSDRLIRLRVPAEPVTGYGVFNPQKILSNYIDNTFAGSTLNCADGDFKNYYVEVGEAYTYIWSFTGTTGVVVGGSTFLLNVKLTSAQTHYYQVGDIINISGCAHAPYNGNWEILDVPNATSITLNLEVSTLSSFTGDTKLFNDEQTFFTNLETITDNIVHNAAIDTYDYIDYRVEGYVEDNYYPSALSAGEFYTNAFDGYKCRLTNRGSFISFQNVYLNSTQPNPDTIRVTSNKGVFDIPVTCTGDVVQYGVFPWNVNNAVGTVVVSGSLPAVDATTESYTVSLRDTTFNSLILSWTYGVTSSSPLPYYPAGTYGGKNYYTWTSGIYTFFLWYDLPNLTWVVSNALGGGNDYLISISAGSTYNPPIGVYGVQWLDGSNPLFSAFTSVSNTNPDLISPFTINLYDFCGKWDNFEFLFMDRKGSWLPMNFELVQRKKLSIDRKTFKRGMDRDYTYTDKSTIVSQNNLNYSYTVVSNWFTEEQSLLFDEFLSSPEILWNYEGGGVFIPIVITKLSDEIKDKKNSRLIQYTIEFILSTNPTVQVAG